jgi:hypothetical protein
MMKVVPGFVDDEGQREVRAQRQQHRRVVHDV